MSYALELSTLLLAVLLIIIYRQQHDSLIDRRKIDVIYDYIVKGAGAAGSVVANAANHPVFVTSVQFCKITKTGHFS
jgi:hypothetical protein